MNKLHKYTYPYLVWMGLLVLVPTLLVLLLSVTTIDFFNIGSFEFTLENFKILARPEVKTATINSIKYSFIATIICFMMGYPIAYFLSNLKTRNKTFIVTLLIIPIWSNMLLRIIAWEKLFYPNSILNIFGLSFDLIGTDTAIIIGMVSMYLPFMVLPIYSVLEKIDNHLLEASRDLGANELTTFLKVVFPLSISGIVSGTIMTLLPAMTAFALPSRLGGGKILLIGNIIEDYFMLSNLPNAGSLISIILMIVIIGMFVIIIKFDKEGENLI